MESIFRLHWCSWITIDSAAWYIAMNLQQTRQWCARAHGDQKYGQHRYSYHLEGVEAVALRFGFREPKIRKACWAHDVLEDTSFTAEDMLAAGFEPEVVEIALAVTDEPGADRHERKLKTYPKIKRTPGAVLVKLFDRIFNAEESLKNNPGKLDTYRLEHAEFEEYLRDPSDVTAVILWEHLQCLLF